MYTLRLTIPFGFTVLFACSQGGPKRTPESGPGPLNVRLGPIEYERDYSWDRYYADLTVKNTSKEIIAGAIFTSAVVSETLAGQVIEDSFKGIFGMTDLTVKGTKGYYVDKPLKPEEGRMKRFEIYSIRREVADSFEWSSAQVQIHYTTSILGKENDAGPYIVGLFTITEEAGDNPK
jgi:hypothetical protein